MSNVIRHPGETTAKLAWIAFILFFFALQATLWTFAISMTANDASHAVVTGYDQQALDWDSQKDAMEQSKRLGWSYQIESSRSENIRDRHRVTLRLTDAKGQPVGNATLALIGYHRAAAAKVYSLDWKETQPGLYTAQLPSCRVGKWTVEGAARRGEASFLIHHTYAFNHPGGG